MNRGLSSIVLAAIVMLSGCRQAALRAARDGLPEISEATIPLAGDDSASNASGLSQPLLGETADLYAITRGVTSVVNLGVVWALTTVRLISLLPPTSYEGNTITWGPSEPKGLEAKNNFKLTATRNDDGSVSYDLWAKNTTEDDTHWRAILSGTHVKGTTARSGRGTLHVDWELARELDRPRAHFGSATVTYGAAAGQGYTVDVDFHQVKDGNSGRRRDATYRYAEAASGAGTFTFVTEKDLRGDGSIEALTTRSRWEATGRGRSDVRASGGSLAADATISECWDDAFKRTFVARSYDPSRDEGAVSACAYSDAAFPE